MGDTEVRRLQLEIIMDETGAIVGAKNISKANKKIEKSTEQTGKKMAKITKFVKSNWIGVAAVVAGALVTIKKAFDLSKAFLNYRQGMDALARNTGQNADSIVAKLKEVSQGTISNKDIMLAANRAVALNVTKDMDQVGKLLEIARVKGKAMGIDTTQAFNDMVTGIGRGSPLILDNLGIITKGWDKEAKAAGKAMDTQFILNKILKQGAVELSQAGAGALTDAERFQKLNATWSNARLRAGKFLSGGILPLVDGLTNVLTPSKGIEEITQELIVSQAAYTNVVKKLKDEQNNLSKAEKGNLLIRKQVLELDILSQIDALNKAYAEQRNSIRLLTTADKENQKARNSLRETLATSKAEYISLSKAQARVLGLSQLEDIRTGVVTNTSIKRTDALRRFTTVQKNAAAGTVARLEAEQKLNTIISLIATALKNKAISEEQLIGLDDRALKQIKERIPLLEKENKLTAQSDAGAADAIETKTEKLKGSVADFYAFVDEQRKLDLLKEEEARQAALEGLAQHQLSKKEIKEIEALEDEEARLAKMEKLLADNVFFEQLESQHQANINKIKADSDKKRDKAETAMRKAELAATKSTLGDISSLTSSSNKKLFAIGKAAAISRAVINVFESITATMASVPFPFNIPLASLQSIAGFAQVDKIKSQTMAEGGELHGPSHAQGGVNVNAEGGEFMVRKSSVTAGTLPILTAINRGMTNLASLSIPANRPSPGMQAGGSVSNDDRRFVSIEKVEIKHPDPEELFERFIEFGEDMGVNIARRK